MPKFNFCRCVNPACNAKFHKITDPELRKMVHMEIEVCKEKQRLINNLLKTNDVEKIVTGVFRLV